MFALTVHNAPSVLLADATGSGFDLVTIVMGTSRPYRISREIPGNENSLRHYDFVMSFAGYAPGDMMQVRIPYRNIDYEMPDVSTIKPVVLGSGGEPFQGHLFKLIYLNDGMFDRGVPSYVDPAANYIISLADRTIRFVFYRMLNGEPRFTGVMRDLMIDGDAIPPITPNPAVLAHTVTIDTITYHIIKLTGTPNVVLTFGTPLDTGITETYDDTLYRYTLIAPGNAYAGTEMHLTVIVTRLDEEPYTGPAPVVYSIPANSIDTVTQLSSSGNVFTYSIKTRLGISAIELKATVDL